MEYRLTQGLSGHGCFGGYLATRGHRSNSNFRLCGEEEDDGEHTIFACPVHKQDRRELTVQVGSLLSKDNTIATMLKSPDSWDRIASFIRKAIKTKEEKEREIQLERNTAWLRNTASEEGSSGIRTSPTEVILKRGSGGC